MMEILLSLSESRGRRTTTCQWERPANIKTFGRKNDGENFVSDPDPGVFAYVKQPGGNQDNHCQAAASQVNIAS